MQKHVAEEHVQSVGGGRKSFPEGMKQRRSRASIKANHLDGAERVFQRA